MKYFSTNGKAAPVNFKEATVNGIAPDKGLYFPEFIPKLTPQFFDNLDTTSNSEIALEVIQPYTGNTIPMDVLTKIVEETINFPIPLVQINDRIAALELFHGPTLAFKDVGARFMSRCLSHFVKDENKKVTVLVATSGDTGGAVANGFLNVPNVDVIILYPSGKVSTVQEKQLTTAGGNIHALEINGSFDDCQQMVKTAFGDEEVKEKLFLTSANSINVARWLPQQFYYFLAVKQWQHAQPPVIAVPSGNFGNICAGILAHASGLPVSHFIAACNANDVIPDFLSKGIYSPKPSVSTLSNAMDVGNPSNFIRILEIFSHKIADLKERMSAVSITDLQTKTTIKHVYDVEKYLLDPHGAVGYFALNDYLQQNDGLKGIVVETAHPVKFYDVVAPVIGTEVPVPEAVELQLKLEKKSTVMEADYRSLKEYLFSR